MKTVLIVLGLVLLLTGLFAFLWHYFTFRSSPKAIWARRMLGREAELKSRLKELEAGPPIPRSEQKLGDEFFAKYLVSIPFSAVQGYPGIGPGTVDMLREWNFHHLGEMIGYDFMKLPRFGPVKSQEMTNAVNDLHKQARKRFDAGACAEGAEFKKIIAEAERARAVEADKMKREAKAIERALSGMRDLIDLAQHVTYMNFLTNSGTVPGLDDITLGRSFPEVVIESLPVAKPVTPQAPPVGVAVPSIAKPSASSGSVTSAPPVVVPPPAPRGDLFERELSRTSAPTTSVPQVNQGLLKLQHVCGFLMMVAKADGRVAKNERMVARAILGDYFGHDPVLVRHIDPTLERLEKNIPSEADALQAVVSSHSEAERKKLYAAAVLIADASGERNTREDECLTRIAVAFGITVAPVTASAAVPTPTPPVPTPPQPDARTVLDIDADTVLSVELIRRRFTLLTEKSDPVKAASFGPEFVKLAEAKRDAVRRAALVLIAPFGEPLEKPAVAPPTELRENTMLDDVFGA